MPDDLLTDQIRFAPWTISEAQVGRSLFDMVLEARCDKGGADKIRAERGVIVICTGGGGVPVIARHDGSLSGVEDAIDKDLASSLLARALKADTLLMLTDVEGVYIDYGTATDRPPRRVGPKELSGKNFPAGSMGPKDSAAIEFIEATGKPAATGKLNDAIEIVRGEKGHLVRRSVGEISQRDTPTYLGTTITGHSARRE